MRDLASRPPKRAESTIHRWVEEELIIVEEGNDEPRVHCLSAPAGKVWLLCDGKATVEEISSQLVDLSGDTDPIAATDLILAELEAFGLLSPDENNQVTEEEHSSRREVLGQLAAVAGFAMPLVATIGLPTPANAVSFVSCSVATTVVTIGCGSNTATLSARCKNSFQCPGVPAGWGNVTGCTIISKGLSFFYQWNCRP